MDKPTIELIRFDASDVIATSGPVTLTVSNFKNGTQGDLSIKFGNDTYNGFFQANDFDAALRNEGYTSTTNRYPTNNTNPDEADLWFYFSLDYTEDYVDNNQILADDINGTYTYIWYGSNGQWEWTSN